jgi:hypothetical protein
MKTNEEILERKRQLYKTKKKEDPDFFRKKARKWAAKKRAKDPKWNADRQRKFRKEHPDKYNYLMARHYLKKLTSEKRAELVKELANGH